MSDYRLDKRREQRIERSPNQQILLQHNGPQFTSNAFTPIAHFTPNDKHARQQPITYQRNMQPNQQTKFSFVPNGKEYKMNPATKNLKLSDHVGVKMAQQPAKRLTNHELLSRDNVGIAGFNQTQLPILVE